MGARIYHRETLAVRRMVAVTVALAALMIPTQVSAKPEPLPEQCRKWQKVFDHHFPRREISRRDRQTLMRVMWRESKCRTLATGFNYIDPYGPQDCTPQYWKEYMKSCKYLRPYGRGVDWGLMQVNGSWRTVTIRICGKPPETGVLLKADCNLAVARWLYDNGGMGHWAGQSGASRK